MGNSLNPGPPLTAAPEFCACEPPTTWENVKAAGAALLIACLGAGAQLLVAVTTGRLWVVTTVVVGGVAGWLVNRAAGRHRSVLVGAFAAGGTLLGAAAGYGLLWLPALGVTNLARTAPWYYLALAVLGGFVAYRLASPKTSADPL